MESARYQGGHSLLAMYTNSTYNKQEHIAIDVDKLFLEIHLSSSNKHKRFSRKRVW